MTAPRKKRFKLVAKTRPVSQEIPQQRSSEPVPPVFQPNPDSVLPHRRCCRESCRATIPVGFQKCLICGCRIISTEPLNKCTIYIEEF